MAETNGTDSGEQRADGQVQQDTTKPQVALLAQYLRDLSFENPNAPRSLQEMGQSKHNIDINVNVNARRVGEEGYEIVLNITAKAILPEKENLTCFLAEISYAGLFGVRNISQDQLEPLLLVECPRLLFPFARRVVADATRDGGFPPLLLEPFDFMALYQKHRAEQAATGTSSESKPQGPDDSGFFGVLE